MYVFIDESGIHKQDGNSSVALVYVMVEDIDNLNKAVTNLEMQLAIQPFHWSKHNWTIRRKFFEGLHKEIFSIKAMILQNPFSEENFEMALRTLLTGNYLKGVIIDGKKTISYVLKLKKILREHHISAARIRAGNDKSFPGLRVADAYAGLIRYYFDNPESANCKELYELAKNKITTLAGGPVSG